MTEPERWTCYRCRMRFRVGEAPHHGGHSPATMRCPVPRCGLTFQTFEPSHQHSKGTNIPAPCWTKRGLPELPHDSL